jgi:hypothetical protein
MSVQDTTVRTIVGGTELSEQDISDIQSQLIDNLESGELSNSEAVKETFVTALEDYPSANATDIWNYGIYRSYLSEAGDTVSAGQQSWRRVSGSAFEHFVVSYYNQRLPRYLKLAHVTQTEVADVVSSATGKTASDIVDAVLLGRYDGEWHAFAGVNTLTSLKGRLQNHTTRTDTLRKAGLSSLVVTLDSHIPNGSVQSEGELTSKSDVNQLIGRHNLFDGLFSFNETTEDVEGATPVRTVGVSRFSDAFTTYVAQEWEEFVEPLVSTNTLQL